MQLTDELRTYMASKELLFSTEARAKLKRGIDQLA